ncbi:hypothetical protein BST63_00335 [Bradyrhizobium canariense]|uniref:Uncharacterized protein n=1 Tax=Bradyrhizobium canariense TaxID=255045 RepID=A0ABX3XD42_9BRAD|nr:hypothetical protein [Bradyrhizobium canariense]OSJ20001.1 hypothetical protein BSR47_00230 [Bradyrhizobium canariense]OSJ36812.1 hypothetical protein BST63_00335 [Bradyrhizobium canariense]
MSKSKKLLRHWKLTRPEAGKHLKRLASITRPHTEEEEVELTSITRAFDLVFSQLPFIAQARNIGEAKFDLNLDIGNAVRAAIASEQDDC